MELRYVCDDKWKIKRHFEGRLKLTIMNEDQLVLYTDVSTKAIAGVLMQIQEGIVKPCIFVLHTQSKQNSIVELEHCTFVHGVKYLTPLNR